MAKAAIYHTLTARILHWANAAIITLLIITGLYINNPLGLSVFTNMDLARKLHFILMYLFITGIFIRVYYYCVNRQYRAVSIRFWDLKHLPGIIKYYLFKSSSLPAKGRYNPGQKLLYNGLVVMSIFQALTGYMLYSPEMLTKYSLLLGGPVVVRQTHFLMTWIFISFIIVHVYLALLSGLAVVKSMFTGIRDNTVQEREFHSFFINK